MTLKDVHLTFGGTPLLEGAELTVAPADRICLVGRNGSGKSTLLKIAAGMVQPDSGERFAHPGATVQYLPQEADFSGFDSVRGYVEAGLGPTDDPYQAQALLDELGLTGDEVHKVFQVAKPAARLLPVFSYRSPTCCYSMSRQTISTCQPSNGSNPN